MKLLRAREIRFHISLAVIITRNAESLFAQALNRVVKLNRLPKITEPVSPRHHPVGVNACCPLPNFDSEQPLRFACS
jgi:hypothetical protein